MDERVMDRVTVDLTVFFDDPFWVGIFERSEGGMLSVAKVTFGAEPGNYDVYEFILEHYYDLQFSLAVKVAIREEKRNPKKKQKDARKMMQKKGIGTIGLFAALSNVIGIICGVTSMNERDIHKWVPIAAGFINTVTLIIWIFLVILGVNA